MIKKKLLGIKSKKFDILSSSKNLSVITICVGK